MGGGTHERDTVAPRAHPYKSRELTEQRFLGVHRGRAGSAGARALAGGRLSNVPAKHQSPSSERLVRARAGVQARFLVFDTFAFPPEFGFPRKPSPVCTHSRARRRLPALFYISSKTENQRHKARECDDGQRRHPGPHGLRQRRRGGALGERNRRSRFVDTWKLYTYERRHLA